MKSKLIYINLLFPWLWSFLSSSILNNFKADWIYYYSLIDPLLLTPLLLFSLNIFLLVKKYEESVLKCGIFMLIGLYIPLIYYWGINYSDLSKPDNKTIGFYLFAAKHYVIIVSVVFGAMALWRWYKKRAAN